MTAEKNQVLNLIADYQSAVAKAVALLNAKAKREPRFQKQQEQPGCYAGYLDEAQQIRYAFHGAGCLVAGPEFKVDLDFAYTDRCDGINSRLLFYFLRSNANMQAKYALLMSADQLTLLLPELGKDGILARKVGALDEHLYHLAADMHKPNPLAVILYSDD